MVSHSDYGSPGILVYFPDTLQLVLRVLEKRETSAVEARARDSRARGLKLGEAIWRPSGIRVTRVWLN